MSHQSKPAQAAVGFRVKSGWATAVLLAGPLQSPQVLDSSAINLSDPAIPESKQPYHAGFGELEKNDAKIAARVKVVQRVTNKSVTELLKNYHDTGCRIRGAGLVVGSQIDPNAIKNPHIRAHALEGQLFKTVLVEALQSCGLPCSVAVERSAYSQAAAILVQSENDLKRAVAELGRSLGGPWRADEKMAALAAWMLLV